MLKHCWQEAFLAQRRLLRDGPHDTTRVLFPELGGKPIVATFDREQASSDGGAVLLKAAERVYDLVKGFARCLVDTRAPEKIRHTLEDLVGQRVFGIACGHPDGNDADHLAEDPIHKLLLDRDPVTGERLASQPALSRFENDVGPGALYRMAEAPAESVIERHRQRRQGRARRITIDLDPTDDPSHGAQQLTFFNGFYDTWCYLPLLAFVTFGREAEQYLCAAVLRPGNAVASEGAVALLSRLLVRLDAGFATPEVFDFLDACPRVDYVVAMPKNAVLVRHAEPAMTRARRRSARSGQTEHVYGETRYAAGSWKHQRRVVIKAEVVRLAGREPRDNPRFVVTNLGRPPRSLYESHCARGDIENRIKELLDGLQIDRMPGPGNPPAGFASGRSSRSRPTASRVQEAAACGQSPHTSMRGRRRGRQGARVAGRSGPFKSAQAGGMTRRCRHRG